MYENHQAPKRAAWSQRRWLLPVSRGTRPGSTALPVYSLQRRGGITEGSRELHQVISTDNQQGELSEVEHGLRKVGQLVFIQEEALQLFQPEEKQRLRTDSTAQRAAVLPVVLPIVLPVVLPIVLPAGKAASACLQPTHVRNQELTRHTKIKSLS